MATRTKVWLAGVVLAVGVQAMPQAFAQVGGSNGPITGIPSGLGANGSMTFTPGPANQPVPSIGESNLPVIGTTGGRTRRSHTGRRMHGPRSSQ